MRLAALLALAAAFQPGPAVLAPTSRARLPAPPLGASAVHIVYAKADGFAAGRLPSTGPGAAAAVGVAALAVAAFSVASREGSSAPRSPQRPRFTRRVSALRMAGRPLIHEPEKAGLYDLSGTDRAEGTHGTGFRFMPLSQMPKDSSPHLVCIAGAYPGISAEELLRVKPLPVAPQGKWNYHVLSGETSASAFVCLPGHSLLDRHPNTIGVVCQSRSLGIEFSDGNVHEVIALIDRSDAATVSLDAFDDQKFYAFADENGTVQIRWLDEVPAGWRILGKLLYTQMPLVNAGPDVSDGFAELSDEFEF